MLLLFYYTNYVSIKLVQAYYIIISFASWYVYSLVQSAAYKCRECNTYGQWCSIFTTQAVLTTYPKGGHMADKFQIALGK